MGLIAAMHGLLWAAQGGVRGSAMPGLHRPEAHACTAQFIFSKNRDGHRVLDGSPMTARWWQRTSKNILAGRAAVRFHSGSCDSWNSLARQVARMHAAVGVAIRTFALPRVCSKSAFCRSLGCRPYPSIATARSPRHGQTCATVGPFQAEPGHAGLNEFLNFGGKK
jgi:hypothetical protein